MKKILNCILVAILLLGPGAGSAPSLRVAGTARVGTLANGGGGGGGGGCTVASGSIFNENYEGAGYDEGATGSWTETGDPDQDAALPGTSPCSGLGSQCTFASVTTGTEFATFDLGSGTTSTRYFRWYQYIDSEGFADDDVIQIFHAENAGGDRAFTVRVKQIVGVGIVMDALGTSFSAESSAISLDTWYRIEVKWVNNSTGGSELKIFNSAGTQVGSTITWNTDTTQFQKFSIGVYANGGGVALDIYFDGLGIDATGYLGQ